MMVLNLVMELWLLIDFLGADLTFPLLDVGWAAAAPVEVPLPEVAA